MGKIVLPSWAREMREVFKGETLSQFILTGNIRDLVPHKEDDVLKFMSLGDYLTQILFQPFDTVIFYDRGKGIQLAKGAENFFAYLQIFDKFHGTGFAAEAGVSKDPDRSLQSPGLLPRKPEQAIELIDRFLQSRVALTRAGKAQAPKSVAVVVDYAEFIVPRGESLYLSSELGSNLIKILGWAQDPAVTGADIVTVLLAENLLDLSDMVVDSPHNAKVKIGLPAPEEIREFVETLVKPEPDFAKQCEVDTASLAAKLVGLSRINVKNLILRALRNQEPITLKYLTRLKKETIEKEAMGRLEFIETRRTLDDVAGQEEAKAWLRDDAKLIRRSASRALPMGYLITGRIGTGKTYLVECFAGECGIPVVAMKNFREKWVGATEGNLEKIFSILHALGQVVVFVDEADQATGKRGGDDGDSGLSGRVYGMMAAEMADTDNRGKIFWIFATSRPDLLEVDLKRQGRLDVHIPLFPPVDPKEKKELFLGVARKLKVDLKIEDIPDFNFPEPVSGNELEGLLVRAVREFELQDPAAARPLPEMLRTVAKGFRPSAHTVQMEMMDLQAVKECTDDRFLPVRFRSLSMADVDKRLRELELQKG